LKANDIAHWQTTLITDNPDQTFDLLRHRLFALVSPKTVELRAPSTGFNRALLIRDLDGHALRLAAQ
jgi:hypothetical protein